MDRPSSLLCLTILLLLLSIRPCQTQIRQEFRWFWGKMVNIFSLCSQCWILTKRRRCYYRDVPVCYVGKSCSRIAVATFHPLIPWTDICLIPIQRISCVGFSRQHLASLYVNWAIEHQRNRNSQWRPSTLGHQLDVHQPSRSRLRSSAECR
jgi:hypothetical protein